MIIEYKEDNKSIGFDVDYEIDEDGIYISSFMIPADGGLVEMVDNLQGSILLEWALDRVKESIEYVDNTISQEDRDRAEYYAQNPVKTLKRDLFNALNPQG